MANHMQLNCPNLFIVGAAKSGSSSLSFWLSDHPDVVGSKEQELRFLMDEDDPLARPDGYWGGGIQRYASHYPDDTFSSKYKHVLDTTPLYYYQDTAKNFIPDVDNSGVIFTLRDPADRILSLYNYAKNNMSVIPSDVSFERFIDIVRNQEDSPIIRGRVMLKNAIRHSRYSDYVREWVDLMGPERVHIVIFEQLTANPRREMNALAQKIGIDPAFYDSYSFEAHNQSFSAKSHLIHKFSRGIKDYVPGGIRKAIKPLYMAMNSRKSRSSLSESDLEALNDLRMEFGDWQRELSI